MTKILFALVLVLVATLAGCDQLARNDDPASQQMIEDQRNGGGGGSGGGEEPAAACLPDGTATDHPSECCNSSKNKDCGEGYSGCGFVCCTTGDC